MKTFEIVLFQNNFFSSKNRETALIELVDYFDKFVTLIINNMFFKKMKNQLV